MGLFDFVKEAGAKIGIGESKAEKTAKAEAASAERAAEVAKRVKERKTKAVKAARMERLAENRKAAGLELYVKQQCVRQSELLMRDNKVCIRITALTASASRRSA